MESNSSSYCSSILHKMDDTSEFKLMKTFDRHLLVPILLYQAYDLLYPPAL